MIQRNNFCFCFLIFRKICRNDRSTWLKLITVFLLVFFVFRAFVFYGPNVEDKNTAVKLEKFFIASTNGTIASSKLNVIPPVTVVKDKIHDIHVTPKPRAEKKKHTKKKATKKKKDNSVKYSLAAFKKYLNASVPMPLDHHDISFLMNPKNVCEDELGILVVVHSRVTNKERRDAIRFSVGRHAENAEMSYKIIFVLGTPDNGDMIDTLRENSEFKDLLMIDTVDTYRNMTLKAVGWIKWVTETCENKPKFILKMDDDALIKMPKLIDMLKTCTNVSNDLICKHMSCLVRAKEPSLRYGKNKITVEEYPLKHYPPMCPGLMYIFPSRLVSKMLAATEKVPFIWLDDVYITVFVRIYMEEHLFSLKKHFMQPADKKYKQLYDKKMIAHLNSKHFATDYIKIWNEMVKSYTKQKKS